MNGVCGKLYVLVCFSVIKGYGVGYNKIFFEKLLNVFYKYKLSIGIECY